VTAESQQCAGRDQATSSGRHTVFQVLRIGVRAGGLAGFLVGMLLAPPHARSWASQEVDQSWLAARSAAKDATTPSESRLLDIWAACGYFDTEGKQVRIFNRYRGDAGDGIYYITGGTSALLCGVKERYGYRHILGRHRIQWEADARLAETDWRSHADWTIEAVLRDPDKVSYHSFNDTYCYSREIYFHRNNVVVAVRKPRIIIAAADKKITTAYPTDEQCPDNNRSTMTNSRSRDTGEASCPQAGVPPWPFHAADRQAGGSALATVWDHCAAGAWNGRSAQSKRRTRRWS
jgi:hypothetical protein